jgi:hypothetical protein
MHVGDEKIVADQPAVGMQQRDGVHEAGHGAVVDVDADVGAGL